MLRVSSLGLSLSQCTRTTPHPFSVPTWFLFSQSLQAYQVRLTWNITFRYPEHGRQSNDSDEDRETNGEGSQHFTSSFMGKKNNHHVETLQKPIRPLRSSRPPPGCACASPVLGTKVPVHPPCIHAQVENDISSASPMGPHSECISSSLNRRDSARFRKGQNHDKLLGVLAKTNSIAEAWEAYDALLRRSSSLPTNIRDPSDSIVRHPPVIPYEYLHRFARMLSTAHPRTRRLFLRLLSVLTTLRDTGGTIFVWEWNALMDCAGKGWRKTTMDDYHSALGIFKDMVIASQASSSRDPYTEIGDVPPEDRRPVAQPDIVTFTTLLDIASRSLSENAINHATSLLDASELPWSHVTHMVKLRYLTHTQQLDAVIGFMRGAVQRGLDLATLNCCLWAFARSGRLRVALDVYELLRCNIPAQDRTQFNEVDVTANLSSSEGIARVENPILSIPGFVVPDAMCPDKVTYTLLIQAMCYHGDFIMAMRIFRDMVSTVDPTTRNQDHHPVGGGPKPPGCYKPSLAIYRAIFLGFSRHGERTRPFASTLVSKRPRTEVVPLPEFAASLSVSDPGATIAARLHRRGEPQVHWTLKNLEMLFRTFLDIGWGKSNTKKAVEDSSVMGRPSDRTIYWIMVAYAKTTGGDEGKMYKVWRELDARFGYGESGTRIWRGRISRLGKHIEDQYRKSG